MKKLRDPYYAVGVYIIGLLIISVLFHFGAYGVNKFFFNYISFSGTFTSVYGIIITYVQILSVKEMAENTGIEVMNSKSESNEDFTSFRTCKGY